MKKSVLVMLFACIAISVIAQDQAKTVRSKIKEVTVFLSGAQITNVADAAVPSGGSTLIFEDLSPNINPQSIQVSGEGNFSILSVTHQLNYMRSREENTEITKLQDSLNLLQKEIDYQNAILSVYQDEENLMLVNKELGGSNNGVKATDIKDAADLYRTRLTEIRTTKLGINAKLKKLGERFAILSNQLNTLNATENQPSSEIVVVLSADAATTGKFTLKYLVANAGWAPSYDLRAVDVKNPIQLVYKANIWQSTGKDWTGVKMTLCTGNPTESGTKPYLQPWYIYYYSGYNISNKGAALAGFASPIAQTEVYDKNAEEKTKSAADYTVMVENQTNITFEVAIPFSVPSDGKYKIVEIQKNTLPAQYQYYSVPKLDKDAFLMARVSGWEQYNLLPGEANIFFEGTYLGKSFIDPRYTRDTLDISLGRDDNISITREKLKDFSSTKVVGSNTKETFTFEITVRNKKSNTVSINLEDQLPLSTDKDIVIEALELSGGILEEESGKITWKFDLKPAETRKFKISYSVKYPKDKPVIIQ